MGRNWTLVINIGAMRRSKARDIDLSMPIPQLRQFFLDDVFLFDALWAVLEPDAKQAGLTVEQFENGMNGEVLDAARECLWAALSDYYPDEKKRMLSSAIATVQRELATAITSLSSAEAKANSDTQSTTTA